MERLKNNAEVIILILFSMVLWWAGVNAAMPPRKIEPELNLTTTTVLVHWYESEQELQLSLGDDTIAGFSECELRPDFNTSFCELWLVRPATDYDFDTIGHEFYHALSGQFHD